MPSIVELINTGDDGCQRLKFEYAEDGNNFRITNVISMDPGRQVTSAMKEMIGRLFASRPDIKSELMTHSARNDL